MEAGLFFCGRIDFMVEIIAAADSHLWLSRAHYSSVYDSWFLSYFLAGTFLYFLRKLPTARALPGSYMLLLSIWINIMYSADIESILLPLNLVNQFWYLHTLFISHTGPYIHEIKHIFKAATIYKTLISANFHKHFKGKLFDEIPTQQKRVKIQK